MSEGAGFQCTAIAFIALLTAFTRTPDLQAWSSRNVNSTLMHGHQLYENIIASTSYNSQQAVETPRYLGHWEMPSNIRFADGEFHVTSYCDLFFGGVGIENDVDSGSLNLGNALQMASEISDFILATFGDVTISVIHYNSEQWYIFDSHSRN